MLWTAGGRWPLIFPEIKATSGFDRWTPCSVGSPAGLGCRATADRQQSDVSVETSRPLLAGRTVLCSVAAPAVPSTLALS